MTDTGAALVLGRVRRAVRTATAGSILSAVVGQIVGVASGVAAARVLGVEGRGYLALLVLFPTIFALVGALGLPLAATFAVAREPRRARAVVHALFLPAVRQALAPALLVAGLLPAG